MCQQVICQSNRAIIIFPISYRSYVITKLRCKRCITYFFSYESRIAIFQATRMLQELNAKVATLSLKRRLTLFYNLVPIGVTTIPIDALVIKRQKSYLDMVSGGSTYPPPRRFRKKKTVRSENGRSARWASFFNHTLKFTPLFIV